MTNLAQTQNYPFCNVTLSSPISNVIGDGTVYTVVLNTLAAGANYNTSTGVFTASANLYYFLTYQLEITGLTSSHTLGIVKVISTFGTFQTQYLNIQAAKNVSNVTILSGGCPLKMNINDTFTITLQISNGAKVAGLGVNSIINVEGFL